MTRFFSLAILAAVSWPLLASAANLPRIASINLCTDQLLMTLADTQQILGLSPFSRDPSQSWDAVKAAQFPRLSGEAEDVLILKPDIVVAGDYTKRTTRELLKDNGLRVEEFTYPRSLDEVKDQMRRMGDLVDHADRASDEIAKLDIAIADARKAATGKPARVLVLSRRGWVTGGDSLANSLLNAAGLKNAAGDLGFAFGGYTSLEGIISFKPDLLLVSDNSNVAEDEGQAFLLHPALEKFYPASKRIALPERMTVCGGSMLIDALKRLTAELQRVGR
ncbi:MAG: ABC transporter substrate-binding protein [Afipia sp.]|nr:ABC transporter substrate-binding protein [Afipia sp.]